jgi:hypothetical protein
LAVKPLDTRTLPVDGAVRPSTVIQTMSVAAPPVNPWKLMLLLLNEVVPGAPATAAAEPVTITNGPDVLE